MEKGDKMGVEKFGVIGSGQMGNGIAQVAAASGLTVLMSDIQQDFCDKGMATIAKNLDRMVSKGKLDQDWETGLQQVDVSKRDNKGQEEIVVAFQREAGDPRQVYIFFTTQGKYAGSNFTGE